MDWKKEYRVADVFRRDKKKEQLDPTPAVEPLPEAAEEQSVWKKEIRLSSAFRRGKNEEQPAQPVAEEPQPEPADEPLAAGSPEPAEHESAPVPEAVETSESAGEPVAGESAEPWQPEESAPVPEAVESFEPAGEPATAMDETPEPETAPEPSEQVPVEPSAWKKEIHVSGLFRRGKNEKSQPTGHDQPDDVEPVPASEPAPASEAAAAAGTAAAASLWKKEIRVSGVFRRGKKEKQPPQPVAGEPRPDPADEPTPAAPPEPAEAAVSVTQDGQEPQALEGGADEPGDVERAREADPAAEAQQDAEEPVQFEPVPEPDPLEDAVNAVAEAPELGAAHESQVGAEAAAATAAAPASVWKKEIRVFRRGKKETTAEPAAVEPTPAHDQPEPAPPADTVAGREAAAAGTVTGVWKKETRFGRKRASKEQKPGGRGKRERRDEPTRRDRSTEDRVARSEARGPRAAGQLPDVPLVRALNLLPREEAKARHGRPSVPQIAVALFGLVVLGGLSFAFIYERSRVQDRRGAVEDLQVQVGAIETPDPVTEPQQGVELAGELLARAGAVSTALDSRVVWDRLLRQLSLVLPADAWFETVVSASAGSAPDPATGLTPPADGGATLTITGYSKTQEGLAALIGRLAVLPQLASAQLQSGTLVERGDQKVVQFSVVATLKPDGGVTS